MVNHGQINRNRNKFIPNLENIIELIKVTVMELLVKNFSEEFKFVRKLMEKEEAIKENINKAIKHKQELVYNKNIIKIYDIIYDPNKSDEDKKKEIGELGLLDYDMMFFDLPPGDKVDRIKIEKYINEKFYLTSCLYRNPIVIDETV